MSGRPRPHGIGLLSLLGLAGLGVGCDRGGPTVYGSAPEVAFVEPLPGARHRLGAEVPVRVRARDAETATADLALTFALNGEPSPLSFAFDGDLHVGALVDLPLGTHQLRVEVSDADLLYVDDETEVLVAENAPPTAFFFEPAGGAYVRERGVVVSVRVDDLDDPTSALALVWSGAADTPEAPVTPPNTGLIELLLFDQPAGPGMIGLTVTDPLGASVRVEATFQVLIGDADGDGHISTVYGGGDCDDEDPAAYPNANEVCNGVDDDCDGAVDEGANDPRLWYPDNDGDGHGRAPGVMACTPPANHVGPDDDCDDTNPRTFPGAAEACNGVDDDCDGQVDEEAGQTWYRDNDGDGYGGVAVVACAAPSGTSSTGGDCDDTDRDIFPGATERCNGEDDNCDGVVPAIESVDADGDGTPGCADCADHDPLIHPGAAERCNVIDDDCDGLGDNNGACPCPVEHYIRRPYQFCTAPATWAQAAAACEVHGYELVSINTAGEDAWVHAQINERSYGYWWSGLAREGAGWRWEDGTALSYSNWGPGEPNNLLGNEDCVELNRFENDPTPHPGWNDQACSSTWRYVCEGGR